MLAIQTELIYGPSQCVHEAAAELKKMYVPRPEVMVITGIDGHKEVLEAETASANEILIFGINYDLAQKYPELHEAYNRRIKKRSIKVYVLVYRGEKNHDTSIAAAETRLFPKNFIASPLVIAIYEDTVVQTVWTEPVLDIIVKNQATADAYRKYFWSLWKLAK